MTQSQILVADAIEASMTIEGFFINDPKETSTSAEISMNPV